MSEDQEHPWRELCARVLLVCLATLLGLVLVEAGYRVRSGLDLLPLRPGLSVPDVYETDPELGYRLRPGFRGHAFGARTEVDDAGRRSTPGPAAPDAPLVAVLGDSTPFGFGVSQEETVAARLEALGGGRFRVENHAVPGYNTRQAVRIFLRDPPPPEVSLRALICFVERNDGGTPLSLERTAGLSYLSHDAAAPAWKVLAKGLVLDSSYATCHLRSALRGRFTPVDPRPAGPTPLLPGILEPVEELRSWARARKTPLLVVLARQGYTNLFSDGLRDLGAREGVAVHVLLEDREHTSLTWDPHPGPSAHRLMAERLKGILDGPGTSDR